MSFESYKSHIYLLYMTYVLFLPKIWSDHTLIEDINTAKDKKGRFLDRELAIKKRLYNRIFNYSKNHIGESSDLSFIDFINIINQPCYYCNRKNVSETTDGYAGHKLSKTTFRYNGIDRVDSKQGYTKINSVPCCIDCNRAKNNRNQSDFREWIKISQKHLTGKSYDESAFSF